MMLYSHRCGRSPLKADVISVHSMLPLAPTSNSNPFVGAKRRECVTETLTSMTSRAKPVPPLDIDQGVVDFDHPCRVVAFDAHRPSAEHREARAIQAQKARHDVNRCTSSSIDRHLAPGTFQRSVIQVRDVIFGNNTR